MRRFQSLGLGALGMLAAATFAPVAEAQITGQTHCGLATSTVVATIFYDPFNPSPVSNQSTTVALQRFVGSGGGAKTQQVDFYFTQPNGSPAFVITSSLSSASNLLYTEPSPGSGPEAVKLNALTPDAGSIGFDFGGVAQADFKSVPITISIPAGLDLSNGLTVNFGIVYVCKGTGGLANENSAQYLPNAVTLPVKVLSALQANFAGPAMDFGNVQQAGTTGHPFSTYLAPTSGPGNIDVKSSGPYTVTLSSANTYLMKDGASGASNQIAYSLKFLGQTLTNGAPTFAAVQCARAGVIGGGALPLRATLAEAANLKTVASYLDTLTVTITPTNFAGATQNCPAL